MVQLESNQDARPQPLPKCGNCWRFPLLLVLLLTGIVLWRLYAGDTYRSVVGKAADPNSAGDTAHDSVMLAIDYGNGRSQTFKPVAWHEGMTVADLLSKAPGLATTQKGSGQGAFLTEIDGVTNEGPDGNNWTYEVNGRSADRSFAVYVLRPGDRVLWRFGPPR
jgi:hypothetical protein